MYRSRKSFFKCICKKKKKRNSSIHYKTFPHLTIISRSDTMKKEFLQSLGKIPKYKIYNPEMKKTVSFMTLPSSSSCDGAKTLRTGVKRVGDMPATYFLQSPNLYQRYTFPKYHDLPRPHLLPRRPCLATHSSLIYMLLY